MWASTLSCGTPWPSLCISPRLYCALAWPCSAALRYQVAAMLAGNWKTARMVAHYAAGATAERGAVAKYL